MSGQQKGQTQPPRLAKTKQNKKPNPNDSQCTPEASEADSIIEIDTQASTKLDSVSAEIKMIRTEMENIVKKSDFEELVRKTMLEITHQLERKIMEEVKKQIEEKFESLSEELKSLKFENANLKDALEKKINKISDNVAETRQTIDENRQKVNDAIKLGNQNEQYSRKNNVKIMNIPEDNQETEDDLIHNVGNILSDKGVELRGSQILAIHRLPSKNGQTRPVIIKLTNNSIKTQIMRHRKVMKAAGHRLVDDVTRLNTMLINRLNTHELIDSAWFFNGSVFGKTVYGKRMKFDIFDDISEVIANHQS